MSAPGTMPKPSQPPFLNQTPTMRAGLPSEITGPRPNMPSRSIGAAGLPGSGMRRIGGMAKDTAANQAVAVTVQWANDPRRKPGGTSGYNDISQDSIMFVVRAPSGLQHALNLAAQPSQQRYEGYSLQALNAMLFNDPTNAHHRTADDIMKRYSLLGPVSSVTRPTAEERTRQNTVASTIGIRGPHRSYNHWYENENGSPAPGSVAYLVLRWFKRETGPQYNENNELRIQLDLAVKKLGHKPDEETIGARWDAKDRSEKQAEKYDYPPGQRRTTYGSGVSGYDPNATPNSARAELKARQGQGSVGYTNATRSTFGSGVAKSNVPSEGSRTSAAADEPTGGSAADKRRRLRLLREAERSRQARRQQGAAGEGGADAKSIADLQAEAALAPGDTLEKAELADAAASAYNMRVQAAYIDRKAEDKTAEAPELQRVGNVAAFREREARAAAAEARAAEVSDVDVEVDDDGGGTSGGGGGRPKTPAQINALWARLGSKPSGSGGDTKEQAPGEASTLKLAFEKRDSIDKEQKQKFVDAETQDNVRRRLLNAQPSLREYPHEATRAVYNALNRASTTYVAEGYWQFVPWVSHSRRQCPDVYEYTQYPASGVKVGHAIRCGTFIWLDQQVSYAYRDGQMRRMTHPTSAERTSMGADVAPGCTILWRF